MPAKKKTITRREFLKSAGAVAAAGLGLAAAGCARPAASNKLTLQKAPNVKNLTRRERLYISSLSPKKRKAWLARKRSGKKTPAGNPAKTRFLK